MSLRIIIQNRGGVAGMFALCLFHGGRWPFDFLTYCNIMASSLAALSHLMKATLSVFASGPASSFLISLSQYWVPSPKR